MPPSPTPALALRARALRVTFSGTVALDAVDLDVPRGALTVVVGANGAGKSTLLEALAGSLAPTSGDVDTDGLSRSFVPQRAAVGEHLPLTVRDVVSVGAWGRTGPFRPMGRTDHAAVDEALRRLDIAALARAPSASCREGSDSGPCSRRVSRAGPTSCCSTNRPRVSTPRAPR